MPGATWIGVAPPEPTPSTGFMVRAAPPLEDRLAGGDRIAAAGLHLARDKPK